MGIEAISQMRNVQMNAAPQTTAQQTTKAVDNTEVAAAKQEKPNASAETETGKQSVKNGEVKDNENLNIENGQQMTPAEKVSNEQLKKAIEQFNKRVGNSEAIFGVHEDTQGVTIKIVDKDTKEVLKELPPEKTLDMIAKVWEMAGILVDEKR